MEQLIKTKNSKIFHFAIVSYTHNDLEKFFDNIKKEVLSFN